MHLIATRVEGVHVVELDRRIDERGFFARVFCSREFAGLGLEAAFVQVNNSYTRRAATLRGLHYQVAPAGEAKLIRCIRGSVFDVALDLRERSSSFGRWYGVELSGENRRMLYVPRGCAHGFLTLEDDCELIYLASAPYSAAHERVVRWDDPTFGIEWPRPPVLLSDKDRSAPPFDAAAHSAGY